MAQDKTRLVWMDLEMTGLDPQRDVIIEIATVITDSSLAVVADGPNLVIHQSEQALSVMNAWNVQHHTESGLIDLVRQSKLGVQEAEEKSLAFIREYVPEGVSPLCGNTICQDRRFLRRYMPKLDAWLHYRYIDVSTVKELARRWQPQMAAGFRKSDGHRARDDIYESINELRYYREYFLKGYEHE